MKRFKHTWFNGMLEDSKGEYSLTIDLEKTIEQRDWEASKKEELLFEWKNIYNDLCIERIKALRLTATLLISIFANIGQLFYHLNI